MNIEEIEKAIGKTGFQLEFEVSSILSKNNWNIINNKYYVDDQQETVREIDIVAYKASSLKEKNSRTGTAQNTDQKRNESRTLKVIDNLVEVQYLGKIKLKSAFQG